MSLTPSSTEPTPERAIDALRYEQDDTRLRWFAAALAGLVMVLAVVAIGVSVVLRALTSTSREVDTRRSIIGGRAVDASGAPPLEPSVVHDRSPAQDLADLRSREDDVFAAFGWTQDASTRTPRVPDEILSRVAAETSRRRDAERTASTTQSTSPASAPAGSGK